MGANDLPGAMASFKQATEQAPKAYGYALNLARAHLVNRDLNGALDVLNGVLKAEPKFVPALALAAAASLQAGQVEKAAGYVERMRQAAPDAPGTLALEGDLAMAQKRYREALDLYRKAGAKGTSREIVLAQYRAGVLSGRRAAGEGAGGLGGRESEGRGRSDGACRGIGSDAGTRTVQLQLYEQGLVQSPDNAVLLNNLAVLYQAKGNPKAVEIAEKAYNAAPKSPAIQDTYGWILFETGNNDKALESAAGSRTRACRTTPRCSTTTRLRSRRRVTRPRPWRC